jgi:hypothetical protein
LLGAQRNNYQLVSAAVGYIYAQKPAQSDDSASVPVRSVVGWRQWYCETLMDNALN